MHWPAGSGRARQRRARNRRGVRLETEYFDARAGRLVENQPGSDHFRVVEYEHRTLGRNRPIRSKRSSAMRPSRQTSSFDWLAPLDRKFGDAPFGQR